MKTNRFILFAFLALLYTGNALIAFAETINTQEYWVLTDGYSEEFTNSGQVTVSYGPYSPYLTEDVYNVIWPGSTGTTNQFFKYDSGALKYYGARYYDAQYGENWVYVPNGPQGFLPAVLEIGKSYTCNWSRREYKNGIEQGSGSDSYTITVTGPHTTTVPAGTFTTYQFVFANSWQTGSGGIGTNYYTYHLARGIGWVKMTRNGFTYELKEHGEGPPSTPTMNLTTSGTRVSISWSAAGATGYQLFYAPYPAGSPYGVMNMGGSTNYSINLSEGAAYYVFAQAYNAYGNSGFSTIKHFVIGYSLSISPSSLSLSVGGSGSCAIGGGTGVYGASSDNTAVATVGLSGSTLYVTGVAAGSATISVWDSGGDSGTVSVSISSASSTYTNSLGMTFILLPAGTFTMGSPSSEPGRDSDEGPQHTVTLTQPLYIQQTEVTQYQWEMVMGSNPSSFSGCPSCPVEQVSWNDIQTFIGYMNARGEGTYNLPTEAQWEYAARAGSTTAFYNGGITETGSGYDPNLNAIGWYAYNSSSQTHPVGQKTPNAWGLYDMSGNVREWCRDWFSSSYYDGGAMTDPAGPSSGSNRVQRGGGWISIASYCRSANRGRHSPDSRYYYLGFRLLRQP